MLDNFIAVISRAWYNERYPMAAKPIKTLELHYPNIQFLIIVYILKADKVKMRTKKSNVEPTSFEKLQTAINS